MPRTTTTTAPAEPGLWSRAHLPIAAGVVALVTLGAFENRALMTILPTVATELDGMAWFGVANGIALATFTLATAVVGVWTDRRGVRPALLTGLTLFVAAQVVSGLAPSMPVFAAGRALSGAAEAIIDVALMVLVAHALPERVRAKVIASFAAAWILPSLLGPALTGAIDAWWGWQAVFLAPLALIPPALLLIRPGLSAAGRDGRVAAPVAALSRAERSSMAHGTALALGITLLILVTPALDRLADTRTRVLVGAGAAAGILLIGAASRGAFPAGTFRAAPGVPSLVASRIIVTIAFGSVGAFLPLMLTKTLHVGPALAGISLSITGTFWALGSWLHSTDAVLERTTPAVRVRVGFVLIAVGALGPLLIAARVLTLPVGLVGWAGAALGMGLISASLSSTLLTWSPEAEQGRNNAAQTLGVSLGSLASTVGGGALIAARADALTGGVFVLLIGAGAATAAAGVVVAGRIRPSRSEDLSPAGP